MPLALHSVARFALGGRVSQRHFGDTSLFVADRHRRPRLEYAASVIKDHWSISLAPPERQALDAGKTYTTRNFATVPHAGLLVLRGLGFQGCSESAGTLRVRDLNTDAGRQRPGPACRLRIPMRRRTTGPAALSGTSSSAIGSRALPEPARPRDFAGIGRNLPVPPCPTSLRASRAGPGARRGRPVNQRHLLLALAIAASLISLSACKKEPTEPAPAPPRPRRRKAKPPTSSSPASTTNTARSIPEMTAAQWLSSTYINDDSQLLAAKANERYLAQLNELDRAVRASSKASRCRRTPRARSSCSSWRPRCRRRRIRPSSPS